MVDVFHKYATPYKSILWIMSGGVSDFRLGLPARIGFEDGKFFSEIAMMVPEYLGQEHDIIVCSRPNPEICGLLQRYVNGGMKVVIDMDDDFFSIPRSNPCWVTMGVGAQGYHDILRKTIKMATRMTVSTPELAVRYERPDAVVIPNYYDDKNEIYSTPRLKRSTVNIGWAGTNTHLEDFKPIEKAVRVILDNYQNTKIVIGGDPAIYELFGDYPEARKMYVPGLPYAYYPSFYRMIDIGLIPLIDNNFNRAKSDIKAVEMGAAGLPFIVSPMIIYKPWVEAGAAMLAQNEDDWVKCLKDLVTSPPLCEEISGKARALAQSTRTATGNFKLWTDLFESL